MRAIRIAPSQDTQPGCPGPPSLCPWTQNIWKEPWGRIPARPPWARTARDASPKQRGGAPVLRPVLPSTCSPGTWNPEGDPNSSEDHTPAVKKDPLLPPGESQGAPRKPLCSLLSLNFPGVGALSSLAQMARDLFYNLIRDTSAPENMSPAEGNFSFFLEFISNPHHL